MLSRILEKMVKRESRSLRRLALGVSKTNWPFWLKNLICLFIFNQKFSEISLFSEINMYVFWGNLKVGNLIRQWQRRKLNLLVKDTWNRPPLVCILCLGEHTRILFSQCSEQNVLLLSDVGFSKVWWLLKYHCNK